MTAGNAAPDETSLTDAVAGEIRLLRKRRGLQSADLDKRVGPMLRELAVAEAADAALLRRTLAAELENWAALLPQDVRITITASLAMSAETRQMTLFGDRVAWLAGQLGRDNRTVLRRIDDAEHLLAEEIASELRRRRGRMTSAPRGWYLAELRTVLRLDTPTPEAFEHRRIVAAQADLSEIMAWLDIPRDAKDARPKLEAEILYGGRLVRKEQPSRNRFHLVVQLPKPLQPSDEHEYGLILRVPPGEPMRPHYIFTPECQCNTFDLRIRFDARHPPRWIRRVDGETVRMFDDARPDGNLVVPDDTGEVHVQFRNPKMYLGYGLQWLQ